MVKVYSSSVIGAPAERVWAVIRDFNGLPKWHPLIRDSRIENDAPADRVGCIRNFNLKDGGIRGAVDALDFDFTCTYSILGRRWVCRTISPRSSSRRSDGDRSFIEWSAEFDCPPERDVMTWSATACSRAASTR
jgi:hypothetical protein